MEHLKRFARENWLTLLVLAVLGTAYLFLRTPRTPLDSVAAFDARLRQGHPTLIEFYSNRCSICLASKPTVDRLEQQLAGRAVVLRVDVADPVGRQLAARWSIAGTPAFIVTNGNGEIVYLSYGPPQVTELEFALAMANHSSP